MNNRYLLLSLLLSGSTTIGRAQHVIQGTVRDKRNELLPGVTILLKGTQNGASTDMQGKYQLKIPHDTATLRFNYVGFISLEKKITAITDTILLPPILLKEDCTIDLFYSKHLELSFLSGLRYTPLGGKVKAFYPYLVHAKNSQGSLRAEFSYQTGVANYQRNATLALDELFLNCDNDLSVNLEYQGTHITSQQFMYQRYSIGLSYSGSLIGNVLPLYLAVGQLNYSNDSEADVIAVS
ncbi:MAG: carboxypeptidase-like regulatory domain-containing protein [Janthinobacterium lividum]